MFDDILRKISEVIDDAEKKLKTPSNNENEVEIPIATIQEETEETEENDDTLPELDKILSSIKGINEDDNEEKTEDTESEEEDYKSNEKTSTLHLEKTSSVKYSSFIEYLENSF
jgi:hypothetical protein